MIHKSRIILVLGVTGQQGSAVARHLLAGGWSVRGLTRDPGSSRARALVSDGAELVAGDMADAALLDAAMAGVYGVFSVQPPTWLPTAELDRAEAKVARGVVDAARRAGVAHFIYSSVLAADGQMTFRPDAKGAVERYALGSALGVTVIRPAGFMENYLAQAAALAAGRLDDPTAPDVPESLVAVDDIGAAVRALFDAGPTGSGKIIDLAGDRLTPPQIAATLSRHLGHPIIHHQVDNETLQTLSPLLAQLVSWLNEHGYPPISPGPIPLQTLEHWLDHGGTDRIKAAGREGS